MLLNLFSVFILIFFFIQWQARSTSTIVGVEEDLPSAKDLATRLYPIFIQRYSPKSCYNYFFNPAAYESLSEIEKQKSVFTGLWAFYDPNKLIEEKCSCGCGRFIKMDLKGNWVDASEIETKTSQ